jgi:hypothetical protein
MPSTMHPCSNDCGNQVAERRPSRTGTHWCQLPACQAAKQRYFRKRRNQQVEGSVLEEAALLVRTIVTTDRMSCGLCGQTNCIPGYAHPDARSGGAPCFHVGNRGAGILPILQAAYATTPPPQRTTSSGIALDELEVDKDHA